jgi:hypothetical protein
MPELIEIRILPPFGIARLGSSPEPMDNYKLEHSDQVGARRLAPAETFLVDRTTGDIRRKALPFAVKFRDSQGRIRPVAPFLEVWARFADDKTNLVPLTLDQLEPLGLTPASFEWSIQVGNIKAYRRTGDPDDKILVKVGPFHDHGVHELLGECANFLSAKRVPLGSVQYIRPNKEIPGIRLRFTPAEGHVYGPARPDGKPDEIIREVVYDRSKGKWPGYSDDDFDPQTDPLGARKVTNPGDIYAGQFEDVPGSQPTKKRWVSWGYLDDECDGIIEVSIKTAHDKLEAFARIAAGPPTFAPDRFPIRTIHDELEQALSGPDPDEPATPSQFCEVKEIVRRALETVRLMNTAYLNQGQAGMARMDNLDYNRVVEPIADPAVADPLALQARHERILVSLEGEALVWFARFLRNYNEVGDLSNEARQKMPAMMRNADGRHLTLTRRQINKVRLLAESILQQAAAFKEEQS